MTYEALLFDLDGTLIYFEPNLFIKTYLGAAAKFFIDLIPNPDSFYQELLNSTDVMENGDNETTTTLEDFLQDFCPKFDVECNKITERFLEFYQTGYNVIQPLISQMDGAKELLLNLKKHHPETKIILATNPVFPFVAVQKRMMWGDISEDFFDLITHAENSYYCKNNKYYWLNIAEDMGINPKNSLMIGNDAFRDLHAKKYGYETFLIETAAENEETITEETEPDFRGSLYDLNDLLTT
ncbi:MAG: HAD family hydrolase [Candidatus Heimdallarchaeota archaeon]|nr:HAD family hydrolase [Candidatus Heimdallarchaeota archaeon]